MHSVGSKSHAPLSPPGCACVGAAKERRGKETAPPPPPPGCPAGKRREVIAPETHPGAEQGTGPWSSSGGRQPRNLPSEQNWIL